MNTLYLDMDGVVADFDAYAYLTLGLSPSEGIYPNSEWEKLRSNPRLYRDLEKTPYADELVFQCSVFAKRNKFDLKFLTAVPKDNDLPWAFYDKFKWVEKNGFSNIPIMFGPYSKDKHMHCKTGDILIDDRTSNIEEWIAAGGYGILHRTSYEHTLEELFNYENIINRS
jgi:hypothetical protein